jgi:hypothetical protein
VCKQYVVSIAPSNCNELAQCVMLSLTVILTRTGPISQAPFSYSFEVYDEDLVRFLYLTNIPIG